MYRYAGWNLNLGETLPQDPLASTDASPESCSRLPPATMEPRAAERSLRLESTTAYRVAAGGRAGELTDHRNRTRCALPVTRATMHVADAPDAHPARDVGADVAVAADTATATVAKNVERRSTATRSVGNSYTSDSRASSPCKEALKVHNVELADANNQLMGVVRTHMHAANFRTWLQSSSRPYFEAVRTLSTV